MAQGTLVVSDFRELNRALARASRTSARIVRKVESRVAVPVQQAAQRLAVEKISGLRRAGPAAPWAQMRIGATQKTIYIAPKEKGRRSKGNPAIRRPNLKDLLLDKAMEPALAQNEAVVVREFGRALDELATHFGN